MKQIRIITCLLVFFNVHTVYTAPSKAQLQALMKLRCYALRRAQHYFSTEHHNPAQVKAYQHLARMTQTVIKKALTARNKRKQ